ncbi:MAG: ABC transporter permease [Candidatus Kapabacteria bacterium]|nr:ABC transporter permease [Candidatus Kapabacteria bacterium]
MAVCTDVRRAVASIRTNRKVSLTTYIARRFTASLRNDGFARFTTVVSYASVALGCVAVVVAMSILEGYEAAVRSTMTRFTAPIEIRSLASSVMVDAGALAEHASTIDGVSHAQAVASREALGRSRDGVDGILLIGARQDWAATTITPMVTLGRTFGATSARQPQSVIGVELARRLSLHVGDTMVIYTADAAGTAPIIAATRISGLFRSGMQQYDETAVFMDELHLRRILRQTDAMGSYVAVYPDSSTDINAVADRLRTSLHGRSSLYVQTYRERFQAIESWIELQKEPIPIILGLISLVAVFTVIATLLITVVEKTRQLAVLKTLGMTTADITKIFLWRGLQVGLSGWAIGSTLALAFCLAQQTWQFIRLDGSIYYVSSLPVAISLTPYLVVAATSLLTSLVASVAPVIIATRLAPARALQFR